MKIGTVHFILVSLIMMAFVICLALTGHWVWAALLGAYIFIYWFS